MEPHEEIWKKETGQWYDIQEHSDKRDTFAPFIGLHDFDIGIQNFAGTFFRFPLRDTVRQKRVSSHMYTVNKLCELLMALRKEAKVMLIFLRSVRSVEVHEISEKEHDTITDLLKVSVFGDELLHIKSHNFQQRIKIAFNMFSYKIEQPIELTVQFRIKIILIQLITQKATGLLPHELGHKVQLFIV